MCLILLAWNAHPDYRLIVAANRDEFRRRRTRPLARWPDLPIIAGRDAVAGGTWLGVGTTGPRRVAMVTNVREGTATRSGARSRGQLPVEFLAGTDPAGHFALQARSDSDDFDPVNLLVTDGSELWWMTNRPRPQAVRVAEGIHGLSNGRLDGDWPKVTDGVATMSDIVAHDRPGAPVDAYLEMLGSRHRPDPRRLPDTGVGARREADLSPMFIDFPGYGTRASTVLRVGYDGHGEITERRFGWRGLRRGTTAIGF